MTDVFTVPNDQVAARILDGEAVVINLESGVYVGLNPSATALWSVLEAGPRSASALTDALARAHDVDVDEVRTDVQFFLEGLEREGLVVSVDDSELPLDSVEGSGAYLAPIAERYSTLDELMLSGE